MSKEKENRYVALGARLKFLREQWQQSVNDVANTLEINEKMLQAFESGKAVPSAEVLDMLISHFLLTEDQAQDLRDLAEEPKDGAEPGAQTSLEDMLAKQVVMLMPLESKVIYTDSMQATVNDTGVVLQFMQATGNGQSVPVSRLGMSREHAAKMIDVLQNTLNHYEQGKQKKLPPSN